jgi:hypothetical protein
MSANARSRCLEAGRYARVQIIDAARLIIKFRKRSRQGAGTRKRSIRGRKQEAQAGG